MMSIKYPYSRKMILFAAFIIILLILFFSYVITSDPSHYQTWLVCGIFILLGFAAVYYWYKKLYVHVLNGDTALELDEYKLSYYIGNKVVNWKDVASTEYYLLRGGGYSITFIMAIPTADIRINTKYIAGSDKLIYNTILEYFERYK